MRRSLFTVRRLVFAGAVAQGVSLKDEQAVKKQ
jgi:hypothetical protein